VILIEPHQNAACVIGRGDRRARECKGAIERCRTGRMVRQGGVDSALACTLCSGRQNS